MRSWRCAGDAGSFKLLDIQKAYLQVRAATELRRFQTVVWQTFVITRMGLGLSVAPQLMDIIIRWITHEFPSVDNYIDNLLTPAASEDAVAAAMLKFGLPTKPAEPLSQARVFGNQLSEAEDGHEVWASHTGSDLLLPSRATK